MKLASRDERLHNPPVWDTNASSIPDEEDRAMMEAAIWGYMQA